MSLAALMLVAGLAAIPLQGRIASTIAPGEERDFSIVLSRDDYARIRVEQTEVDVVVRVIDPAGDAGDELDSAIRAGRDDELHLIAARSGSYTLRVRAYDGTGAFALTVAEVHPATARDRRLLEAEDLFQSARVLRRSPDGHPAAIANLERASAIFDELGYDLRRADTNTYLGDTLLADRDAAGAIPRYANSIPLLESTGQRARAALSWLSLGHASDQLGDYGRALDAYTRAEEIFVAIDKPGGRAQALLSMGRIHFAVGDYQRALELDREAELAYAGTGPGPGPAIAALNVGRALEAGGDLDGAAASFSHARELLPARGGKRSGQAALWLGRVERRRGRFEAAASEIERATSDFREEGDRRWEAEALRESGELALDREQTDRALAEFGAALDLDVAIDDPAGVAADRFGLARAHRVAGRADRALDEVRQAIATVATIRESLDDPALRSQFASAHRAYDELFFELTYEQSDGHPEARTESCFAATEASRARALRDRLRRAGRTVGPAEESLTLAAARARLAADETLLEYRFAAGRLYMFVVTRDDASLVRLDARENELRDRVANYLELLSSDRRRDWRDVGAGLTRSVLAPVEARLMEGSGHLMVVPDGPLDFLPFETLPLGGARGPLVVERVSVSYAPSAALSEWHPSDGSAANREVWAFAAAPGTGPTPAMGRGLALFEREGLAIGPLPSAEAEARAVARVAGPRGRLFLGSQATRAPLVSDEAHRAGVIHFATHGLVSRWRGERSALLLAPDGASDDGLLEVREIYGLRLDHPMVVLSACDTARGRVLEGEGVLGLVDAFLHAGAETVVASLWSLSDPGASRFMARYYKRLAEGAQAREALRDTKLEFLGDDATSAPRLWAPFVLVGNGARTVAFVSESGRGLGLLVVGLGLAAALVLGWRLRSSWSIGVRARGGARGTE